MKIISCILSLMILMSGFTTASFSCETESLAGPKSRVIVNVDEIFNNTDASLLAITTEAETVKSFSTTYYEASDDCFKVDVNDDGSISYQGNTTTGNRKYVVYLSANEPTIRSKDVKISDNNGNFSGSIEASKVPAGISYIWVYYNVGSSSYVLEFNLIPIIKSGSNVGIYKSEVTDANSKKLDDYNGTDINYYKMINKYCLTEDDENYFEEYKEITDTAKEITFGKTTPYAKALAVHDWLCDNLYYDFDSFYLGDIEDAANPRLAFETKKAVCSGFSRLMSIMLRSVGVACIDVTGFAYDFPKGYTWNDLDHSMPNHEWNMFYDGERWCIVDATWDCGNVYEDGEFTKHDKNHTYFDATQTFFSYSHEVHGYYIKKNEVYSRFDLPAYGGVVYMKDDDESYYVAYEAYGDYEEYIIKDTVLGMPVKEIAPYFMFENNEVEHVYVPSSVKEIGYAAFYNCDDLEKFEYPGNDLTIGDFVLYDCDELTIYTRYNSDLYEYAKDEDIRVKIMGKPKVSKIQKNGNDYDIYYSYVSPAPKEKMFCVVKDENGNLKELKIFNIDYSSDHVTFTPHENGNVGAYIFDNTLEP